MVKSKASITQPIHAAKKLAHCPLVGSFHQGMAVEAEVAVAAVVMCGSAPAKEDGGGGQPAAGGAEHDVVARPELPGLRRVVEGHGDAGRPGVAPLVHGPVGLAHG